MLYFPFDINLNILLYLAMLYKHLTQSPSRLLSFLRRPRQLGISNKGFWPEARFDRLPTRKGIGKRPKEIWSTRLKGRKEGRARGEEASYFRRGITLNSQSGRCLSHAGRTMFYEPRPNKRIRSFPPPQLLLDKKKKKKEEEEKKHRYVPRAVGRETTKIRR